VVEVVAKVDEVAEVDDTEVAYAVDVPKVDAVAEVVAAVDDAIEVVDKVDDVAVVVPVKKSIVCTAQSAPVQPA
jgi:hypothetical protein